MRSSQEEEKACVLVIPRSWDLDRQTKKRILAHVLSFNFSHKQSSQGAFITSTGKIQKKKRTVPLADRVELAALMHILFQGQPDLEV